MQQSTLFWEQGTNKSCTLFPHLYPVPGAVYPVPEDLFVPCSWKRDFMQQTPGLLTSIEAAS